MNRGSGKLLKVVLSVALLLQSIACGTLLHPERKGQRDGRIDAGIAVLDALGLLLFIIPGVIAFAVDFSNGTIYLPPESRRSFHAKDLRRVSFDPKQSTPADLEAILEAETGRTIKLDPTSLQLADPVGHRASANTVILDYSGGRFPLTAAWLQSYFGATVVAATPTNPAPAAGQQTYGLVVVLGHDYALHFLGG